MKASTVVANATTVTRSRAFPSSDTSLAQIGEKIEGARDEHRPELAGPGERGGRIGHGLDGWEMGSGSRGKLLGG